ncbi:MAG: TIGR03617 family F420-dependent LLM class oxidoreductase [Proteobacteria bacterium]|nr:TIGR03617 family F420-dependent LLM class oxidoreductase [Pseudomonadota bacterium]
MKTAGALTGNLIDVAEQAGKLEQLGADIASTLEIGHDPMMQLAIAATGTKSIKLMTSIIVAFARSPMTMALAAHDVNALSKGRLMLGIGSQIKPHIEKRYSMPWSKPASRMREYVLALKAIWACWYEGAALEFRGEFYNHTLMTPMFTPPDGAYGAPPVLVAAVGPLMTEKAAEVADGILLHSFTTAEYIREVNLPAMQAGLARSGRSRADLQVVGAPFFVTGKTEEEFNRVKLAACNQIAFYASTPAYRGVLESIGYGELQPELTALSKAGKWAEMGQRIDDKLLDKLAIVGEPADISKKLAQRFGDIFDICSASVFTGDGYSAGEFSPSVADAIKQSSN